MSSTPDTYAQHLQTLGIDPATLVLDEGGTVVSDALLDVEAIEVTAASGLEMGVTLGQGGMGVVRAARQRALDRPVAVKTLRPDRDSPNARVQMHREAWVTGHLEHPDIVPVYALEFDADGRPVMVMKLVEGVSWQEALDHPEAHQELFDGADALDFHLDILDRVCQAMAYAHKAGVLHRDLKPDNVMLGAFGEVLVVDWGIAVASGETSLGPLPSANRVRGVSGTPGYMAPEMAAGDGSRISPQSDIYLLGAILHRIVTGRDRNAGETVQEMLNAAWAADPPELDDAVPAQLATLIRKATARVPTDRHPDVRAFRAGLQEFRRQQTALGLLDEATSRLARLESELATPEPRHDAVMRLGTEARFALEQARTAGAPPATLAPVAHQLVGHMCRLALDREEADAAAGWLELLTDPPEELVSEVEALRAALATRLADLERLNRDVDARLGRGARSRAALLLMFQATIGTGAAGIADSFGLIEDNNGVMLILAALNVTTMLFLAARGRGAEHARASRAQAILSVLGATAILLTSGVCWLGGVPFHVTVALLQATAGSATVMLSVFEPLAAVAAGIHLLAVAVILLFPAYPWWWMLLGSVGGFLALGWAWSKRNRAKHATAKPQGTGP